MKNLEKFDKLFKRIIKKSGIKFILNTIWDEVSQYYCKSCYPRINEIENLMRKLIFRFMIKNIGSDWVKKSFPQKLKENVEKIAEKNEAEGLLENSLYEADFIQLIEFIFIPYPKNRDINKLFEMINAAEKLDDLKKVKEFQPKSNWERYFSSIIKIDDLEDKWRKLYKYLYELDYINLEVDLFPHNIIYGKLNEKDDFNWMKKIEVAGKNSGYPFEEYENGYQGFYEEFRNFLYDPKRFTYNLAIGVKGTKPSH